jgi:hypothetical protein
MYADRQAVKKKDTRTAFEAFPARGMVDISITDVLNQLNRAKPEIKIASRDGKLRRTSI